MKQKNKLKALAALSILLIGVKMQGREFTQYGLIGGKIQIQAQIVMACMVISPGTVNRAKLLLAETIAVESRNGQAKDHSEKYGEGLTQFDEGTFNDVKDHYSKEKYQGLMTKIKTLLGVDVLNAEYTDLRKSPMLSIVMARLLYLRVPYPIPGTKLGRWQYYKKWFNSVDGATTQVKYYQAMEYAVFQDNNNQVA